jgi:hypothetical protein
MTVRLSAPYPTIQTHTYLPHPQLGDTEQPTPEVGTRRAMDGTLYTYTKTKLQRRKLVLNFKITSAKASEVWEFIRSYHSSQIRYIDHLGRGWIGYIVNNPFEFTFSSGWPTVCDPVRELVDITIEYEGYLE